MFCSESLFTESYAVIYISTDRIGASQLTFKLGKDWVKAQWNSWDHLYFFVYDYLRLKQRFPDSSTQIPLWEKCEVNIWPLSCTKILISGRETLVPWPLLKFKRSVDFSQYFMLRREETNFFQSWPLGDVVLPRALSLNIAACTNVYDRMLKKDLDNRNPSFVLHSAVLKNISMLSRVT